MLTNYTKAYELKDRQKRFTPPKIGDHLVFSRRSTNNNHTNKSGSHKLHLIFCYRFNALITTSFKINLDVLFPRLFIT